MNERILKILEEMDRYLDGGSMLAFIALNRKRIWFDVFFTKQQKEQDINVLELTVRSGHCLYRANIRTLGELLERITPANDESCKQKLLSLRNLGRKSAEEILLAILCYQYLILPDHEKRAYVRGIIERNLAA